jgi:hypothetical protein
MLPCSPGAPILIALLTDRSNFRLENVTTNHEYGSPLKRKHLERLDMSRFDCCIVLCDEKWMDPDENMTNGYDDLISQGDLLRLESVV